MADNSVTLVGNVTRDPELRYTAGGAAKVAFGLAVNRRWQNRQTQEWEEQVSFFNVVAWREMAENVAESIAKGSRIVVTGRLEQRSWETENGEKRTVVEVNADDIGPSLRWATAQITRNERRGGDFAGPGGGSGGGSGGSASGGSGGGGAAKPANPAQGGSGSGGGYDDLGEEPF
ncbi:MAG TPA: single-stranded DNA-binding protein [Acidimicrobiia bacterium]|nr:single-stranded DNA-binding protein [Acidimicrobiia bacterium]